MVMDSEDTYRAITFGCIKYDVISKDGRPDIPALYSLIKLPFIWLIL